jgi:hypothetical protein
MDTTKITSKRPGDSNSNGLTSRLARGLGWLGSLKRYAAGKPHDMASVRQSIEEARRGEKR